MLGGFTFCLGYSIVIGMGNEDFYKDLVDDMRRSRDFLHKMCLALCTIIVALICGIIAESLYFQKKTFDFMKDVDLESTIEMNNDNSTNYGSITAN